MERAKTLLEHAHDYRNLAITFRDTKMRKQLEALAAQCEQIAEDMKKTTEARLKKD